MHFALADDAVALRDGLAELLAGACTPATIRAAWDGEPPTALWKELGAFGLVGLLAAEADGGLGLEETAFVGALEAAGHAGVPGPLVETVVGAAMLGLPLDGTTTLAVRRAAGPVPHAGTATHLLDLTGPPRLRTLVPGDAPQVESVDPTRALADPPRGDGEEVPLDVELFTARATLGTAAFLLGLARRQLELTVGYVSERTQFGVPVGSFQGLKHPLADATVGTEFAWPVTLHAADALAHAAPDAGVRVSHAKAAASDAAYRMSRVCLQAHGAMGYTVEYDLHLYAKRTWALVADWGTAAEHRDVVARHLLEGERP